MAIKIDHIGIAVKSIDDSINLYANLLGVNAQNIQIETLASGKVRAAMIPIGESNIELLESTDPEGTYSKFAANKGAEIHHIAIGVTDIKREIQNLKNMGIALRDNEPRIGVGGHKIAFLDHQTTKILLELVEV
jgi:methylmalonyl-CoA/ethylmalonyl-CoA epimerase